MFVYLCLSVSHQPICGNHIVEDGEECDVGQNDTDLCCYSAKEPVGVQCQLKPLKACRYCKCALKDLYRAYLKRFRVNYVSDNI